MQNNYLIIYSIFQHYYEWNWYGYRKGQVCLENMKILSEALAAFEIQNVIAKKELCCKNLVFRERALNPNMHLNKSLILRKDNIKLVLSSVIFKFTLFTRHM